MSSLPHSIHTFMWPFRWATGGKKGRDNLGLFSNCLTKGSAWEQKEFEFSDVHRYNEYVYYHSHVRDTLFANKDNRKIIRYFNYQLNSSETFEFEVITKTKKDNVEIENTRPFKLSIKGISLHLFFTGVGILTFQLENNDYRTIEDIQLINDFGRRTYPQFLGPDGINATNRAFLPTYIKTSYCTETETFESYNKYQNTDLQDVVQPPAYIKALFRNDFVFSKTTNFDKDKITVTHLTDDRMFTLCWYANTDLSKDLKDENNYLKSKKWYELIFCDKSGNLTCQSKHMLEEHIKRYTYDRWINYGTLYGITRDCLFCLTAEDDFTRNAILPHMRSIYYQMAILCLIQRASVLKFSNDLSDIDFLKLNSESKTKALELQKQYLKFNNKLYFKEVTDQIQGLEMYQMMQKAMNIENVTNQLDREIEELHNLLQSKEAHDLTKIATYAVPASLVLALFALFSADMNFSQSLDMRSGRFQAIALLVVISIIILFSSKWIISKITRNR